MSATYRGREKALGPIRPYYRSNRGLANALL